MKNIVILIPFVLLLAACTCDEENPLISGEELEIPDVFVVTDVRYAEVEVFRDDLREGIQVLFNRNVNPDRVIDSLTFFLEGPDLDFSGIFYVDSNWIFIGCGDFYCLDSEDCQPIVRLVEGPDFGVVSIDGELLDGDRDGKPGGDFIQEVAVTDCRLPIFGLFLFPEEDTLFVSRTVNSPLFFGVDFTSEADPLTLQWDTIGENNVKIINPGTNEPVPFDLTWQGNNGIQSMDLEVKDPVSSCGIGQPCVFRVIIEESFHSLLGVQLDGNEDGIPGGDFIKDYVVVSANGPQLQVKLPGNDTTFLDWPTDTNIVIIDFSFSLPVGPNNLFPGEDLQIFCENGEPVSSGFYNFFWPMNSETDARLEIFREELFSLCGTVDDPNGNPVIVFKAVIADRVQSTGGTQLDGDNNGFPGEDAIKYFILSPP